VQAEDGIRDVAVTGVQTCALPIYRKENTELLCYNHYFLQVGDIFSDKQIKGIEDHVPTYQSEVEWELDAYQLEQLEKLGLVDKDESDDPYSLVSRK